MGTMTDNERYVMSRFLNSYAKISNYGPAVHFKFTKDGVINGEKSLLKH